MPVQEGVELFVVGGTLDTTSDRGIMFRLVTAALVAQPTPLAQPLWCEVCMCCVVCGLCCGLCVCLVCLVCYLLCSFVLCAVCL